MRNLAGLWQELFPTEQCRLAKLLIERMVIADGGLEIIWRDQGWQELAAELGSAGRPVEEFDGMHDRNGGARSDLHHAADIARRDFMRDRLQLDQRCGCDD